jgi:pimeloyl-ACP methyl ester carboxylesterase
MGPLAYDRIGSGPPLVLLHPLGADRRVWDPIVERISTKRELITVDLPGFGDSPPLDSKPTPAALAQAVAAFLAAEGIEQPNVAGNSLGGWVALELALAGSARTVVGIAPAGLWTRPLGPKPPIARRLARAVLPILGPLAATASGRRALLGGTVAEPDRVPPQAVRHLVRAYATAPGFTAVNSAMRSGKFDGLERITVPVTLVWPEHDRLIARPARLPANVDNRELADAGHIPMWDAPDQLAEILLAASR